MFSAGEKGKALKKTDALFVVGLSLVLLALVLYVPWLRSLFHFSTLHSGDIALCLGAGVAGGAWFEAVKRFSQNAGRGATSG